MPKAKAPLRKPYTGRHKDGSLWAKGYMKGDVMDGPWKWFRKDGTIMRSGRFENGTQVGDWVTYDQAGKVYKITRMKVSAAGNKKASKRAH